MDLLRELLPEPRLFIVLIVWFASALFMVFGAAFRQTLLLCFGFGATVSFAFGAFGNWLPQVRSDPPSQETLQAEGLSPAELAEIGRKIVFGEAEVAGQKSIGKGQCPLCHIFKQDKDPTQGRCPNLFNEAERANTRVALDCEGININRAMQPVGPTYDLGTLKSDCQRNKDVKFAQPLSHPDAGRPTTSLDYIIESIICPACFVVTGFGVPGTDDADTQMPKIFKPPISLSVGEMTAVVEWVLIKDGALPVPGDTIRDRILHFLPPKDRPAEGDEGGAAVALPTSPGEKIGAFLTAIPEDLSPKEMIMMAGCNICHPIPGVTHDLTAGTVPERLIGPRLVEKVNAARRIASKEYQADVTRAQAILAKGGEEAEELRKKGVPSAKTPRDYVRESILFPDAHVVKCFREGRPGITCADIQAAANKQVRAAKKEHKACKKDEACPEDRRKALKAKVKALKAKVDNVFPPSVMAAEKFNQKLTAGALAKLVEFLLTIDDKGPGVVADNIDIPVKIEKGPIVVEEQQEAPAPQEVKAFRGRADS